MISSPQIWLDMPRIVIDEEKCDGVGMCASVCPKGPRIYSTAVIDGARKCVVKDPNFCLGCTTCIGRCPKGAISIDFSAP
ncbi:MAG TPA: 4Fe-4S binding protein [Candidatus Acidoferrales bacterium]|nr:4Fe-4S binding protein [Candidatus Acidoferrales bacterium]